MPPPVVMSQYALNGCPVPFGSIQYSPFFCALVYFEMSLQETPGNSGDEPFITEERGKRGYEEETFRHLQILLARQIPSELF